jgi:hypothetical protein
MARRKCMYPQSWFAARRSRQWLESAISANLPWLQYFSVLQGILDTAPIAYYISTAASSNKAAPGGILSPDFLLLRSRGRNITSD